LFFDLPKNILSKQKNHSKPNQTVKTKTCCILGSQENFLFLKNHLAKKKEKLSPKKIKHLANKDKPNQTKGE